MGQKLAKMQGNPEMVSKAYCGGIAVLIFSVLFGNIFGILLGVFIIIGCSGDQAKWTDWKGIVFAFYLINLICGILSLVIIGIYFFVLIAAYSSFNEYERTGWVVVFVILAIIIGIMATSLALSCKAYSAYNAIFMVQMAYPSAPVYYPPQPAYAPPTGYPQPGYAPAPAPYASAPYAPPQPYPYGTDGAKYQLEPNLF
eukprot:TRINITY_DN205_c0_g1_i1.p1 TRINITY_DN205_c0_g1~~TRINITY_DN205_c0_g1_i1.p1  ORF type:complete len:211 (-),score=31.08 TRINITY_DN205_c0_g1_i1:29-625(-)